MILVAILAFRFAAAFVTMPLGLSHDNVVAPTRALTVTARVGVPESRQALLLDFSRSSLHFFSCLEQQSSSYDKHGPFGSDIIQMEDNSFFELRSRGVFRFPTRQRCSAADADADLDELIGKGSCASLDRCAGVLGLGRNSHWWENWSAYSLTAAALNLGRDHPQVQLSVDNGRPLHCRRSNSAHLCEFEAKLADIDVVVDFHTEDSFVYVPEQIYALYMAGKAAFELERGTASKELFDRKTREKLVRVWNRFGDDGSSSGSSDSDKDDRVASGDVREFHRKLQKSKHRAAASSIYLQKSLHRHDWYPLVLERRDGQTTALVLDRDVLLHQPFGAGSFGGVARSSSAAVLGHHQIDEQSALLLRPWPKYANATRDGVMRISIGNTILRRYELHRDVVESHLFIRERVLVEHLSPLETLVATLLYTLFLRSAAHSLELLTPLSLCRLQSCPSCARRVQTPQMQHQRLLGAWQSAVESLFYVVTLAAPIALLWRLDNYVDKARHAWFFAYLIVATATNGPALLANLFYSLMESRRATSGAYCWRSFRIGASRHASAEHLNLLGVLLVLLVLRVDINGSLMAVFAGFALLANAVRHFYHSLHAGYQMQLAQRRLRRLATPQTDLPSAADNVWWLIYVSIVQLAVNVAATAAFVWAKLFWPLAMSHRLAALAVSLALLCGILLVRRFVGKDLAAQPLLEKKDK